MDLQDKRIQKILNSLTALTLVMATTMVVTTTFWLSYPYKTLEIKELTILNKTVKAGGILNYRISYCKYVDFPAEVSRAFIDGVIFTMPMITANNPKGCHSNTHQIPIPAELPSGEYKLRSVWTYKINPIRDISITNISDPFYITGSD